MGRFVKNKKVKKIKKVTLASAICAMLLLGTSGGSREFLASMFPNSGGEEIAADSTAEIFIPQHLQANAGDLGEIVMKTNADFASVIGFAFKLKFNPMHLTPVSAGVAGTDLESKGFLIENNTDTEGELFALGAQGSGGQDLPAASSFFRVEFRVAENVPPGLAIPVEIEDFTFIQETLTGGMSEVVPQVAPGKITIESDGIFRVVDVAQFEENGTPKLAIEFSDFVREGASFDDFAFFKMNESAAGTFTASAEIENVQNICKFDDTTCKFDGTWGFEDLASDFQIDGKKVILSNLRSTFGSGFFKIVIDTNNVAGNSTAWETAANNTAFFQGFASGEFDSAFTILSISETESPRSFVVNFSKAIDPAIAQNPLNFELFNQAGDSLTIAQVVPSGNAVKVTTQSDIATDQLYFFIARADRVKSTGGQFIGPGNAQGFLMKEKEVAKISRIEPGEVVVDPANGTGATFEIFGENFSPIFGEGETVVRLGTKTLQIQSGSAEQISANVPADFEPGVFDLHLQSPNGEVFTLENALIVKNPEKKIAIVPQDDSSILKITNQNGTGRIWVQVDEPRGIAEIERVTADLRVINGDPGVLFQFGREEGNQYFDDSGEKLPFSPIVSDSKRWFFLDIAVPPTVATSESPLEIPVVAENKNGESASGSVKIKVTRDLFTSIAPVIEDFYSNVSVLSRQAGDTVSFYAEVSDADGAEDIAQVVLDLGRLGLGTRNMSGLPSSRPDGEQTTGRACTENDFSMSAWSSCSTSGKQTRTVQLKSGVICQVNENTKPASMRNCSQTPCTRADWEIQWGTCQAGMQTGIYQLKSTSNCSGTEAKPANETRSCPTSFFQDLKNILIPKAVAAGNTAFFQLENIQIPESVPLGTHDVRLIVIDANGSKAERTIQISIQKNDLSSAPKLDEDDITFSPRRGAPNDGVTPFEMHVKATDPDGGDDIASITARFDFGIPPIQLNFVMIEGDGAVFSSGPVTIPTGASPGYREITFTVNDQAGNFDTLKIDDYFKIEDRNETAEDDASNEPPEISMEKSYTTPRAVPNDGETPITFYVFVEKGGNQISSVSMNLGTIARWVGNSATTQKVSLLRSLLAPTAFAASTATTVPTGDSPTTRTADEVFSPVSQEQLAGSDRIVQLQPSVREGKKGQWFILSGVVVDTIAIPSVDPYLIPVTAIDTLGNATESTVKLFVSDGTIPDTTVDLPILKSAVATGENEIEIGFSQALDPEQITSSAFRVVNSQDNSDVLGIRNIEISADGRFVRLKTNDQNKNKLYTIITDNEKLGLQSVQMISDKKEFKAFSENDSVGAPLDYDVEAINSNAVKVTLTTGEQKLKYSTIAKDGSNFEIYRSGGGDEILPITNWEFGSDNRSITLATEKQKSGVIYELKISNLENAAGKKMGSKVSVEFTGFSQLLKEESIFQQADFNGDGKIDLLDHTIFCSVYDKDPNSSVGKNMDLNADGRIDFNDFTLFTAQFKQSSTTGTSTSATIPKASGQSTAKNPTPTPIITDEKIKADQQQQTAPTEKPAAPTLPTLQVPTGSQAVRRSGTTQQTRTGVMPMSGGSGGFNF